MPPASEYRSLAQVVPPSDRILQATPNALTKARLPFSECSHRSRRKPLRTTIVAAMDMKTDRRLTVSATTIGNVLNTLFRANNRWQALAEPFLNYCDGVTHPLFEELPPVSKPLAPAAADLPGQRMFFAADHPSCFARRPTRLGEQGGPRFTRNLADMWVVASPIAGQPANHSTIGPSGGREPLEYFLVCWPNTTRRSVGRQSSATIAMRSGNFLSRTIRRCQA